MAKKDKKKDTKKDEKETKPLPSKSFNKLLPIAAIAILTILYYAIIPHLTGYDEWRHMQLAENIKSGQGYTYFEVPYYKHPPLLPLMANLLPEINDTNIFLFLLIFSTSCLIAMWYLSRYILKDDKYATLALIILGLNPIFLQSTGFFGMELIITLGFMLYYALYRLYLDKSKKSYPVLAGAILGLGLLTKSVFILLIPITVLMFLYTHKSDIRLDNGKLVTKRGALMHLKYTVLIFIIGYAIYYPYTDYLSVNNAPSSSSIFTDEFFGKTSWALFDGSANSSGATLSSYFRYILDFHKIYSYPIAIIFILTIWLFVKKELKSEAESTYIMIAFITTFLFFTIYGMKEHRFVVETIPFAIIFSLMYLKKISSHFNIKEKTALGIIMALLIIQSAPLIYALYEDNNSYEDCPAMKYMSEHTDKDSAVIVYNYNYARFKAYLDTFTEWGGSPPLENNFFVMSILYRPDYYVIFDNNQDSLPSPLFTLEARVESIGGAEEGRKFENTEIYDNPHVLFYRLNESVLDSIILSQENTRLIPLTFMDEDNNPLSGARIELSSSPIPRPYRSNKGNTKIIVTPDSQYQYYVFKVGYSQKQGIITTTYDTYCIDAACHPYDTPTEITLEKTSIYSHGLSFSRY